MRKRFMAYPFTPFPLLLFLFFLLFVCFPLPLFDFVIRGVKKGSFELFLTISLLQLLLPSNFLLYVGVMSSSRKSSKKKKAIKKKEAEALLKKYKVIHDFIASPIISSKDLLKHSKEDSESDVEESEDELPVKGNKKFNKPKDDDDSDDHDDVPAKTKKKPKIKLDSDSDDDKPGATSDADDSDATEGDDKTKETIRTMGAVIEGKKNALFMNRAGIAYDHDRNTVLPPQFDNNVVRYKNARLIITTFEDGHPAIRKWNKERGVRDLFDTRLRHKFMRPFAEYPMLKIALLLWCLLQGIIKQVSTPFYIFNNAITALGTIKSKRCPKSIKKIYKGFVIECKNSVMSAGLHIYNGPFGHQNRRIDTPHEEKMELLSFSGITFFFFPLFFIYPLFCKMLFYSYYIFRVAMPFAFIKAQ
jgi:hypothetical protein